MKLLPIIVAVCLLAAGCTEEIIKIQKEVDTVFVNKPTFIDRLFVGVDTTEIPLTLNVAVPNSKKAGHTVDTVYIEKTVYVPRVDSVFITTTVTEHDTVVVREYSYGDTLYVYMGHDSYQVPNELRPIVTEFYQDAARRGLSAPGGEFILQIEPMDAVLQAYSFSWASQVVIVVNGNQTNDEMFLPIYREMARWQLGQEYSQDPESVMYPFYPSNKIRYSNRAEWTTEIDKIFQ